MNSSNIIRTPDQRLRVFVSSTLRELSDERAAVKDAISQLRLAPIMFELGARPHPAISLYRAYLEQSHIFIGIYWQSYGYVGPGMEVSGLEDEYSLAGDKPRLIYIKSPAPERQAGLEKLLTRIRNDDKVSYKYFTEAGELRQLVENDLALLLTERFEVSEIKLVAAPSQSELPAHNLPAEVTTFIGREAEIAAVQELLSEPQVRLLSLTGPGGTGKTRLSLQIAAGSVDRFKDGVFFVPLAEAFDSNLVISKIAEQLGIREGGSTSLLESVKGFLKDKQMLLLLDNFEQVLEAAFLVSKLLQSAPELRILVTSRVRLNVRGEHEFQVPTLGLPDSNAELTAGELGSVESVRMFVERARAINPHVVLDDKSAAVISEICCRLDGLPLAIELAASRLKMLSPEKLLSQLTNRLKMLTGGSRDLPERQQTLRNTLEWSVQLLNERDQALFARLGVFMGGFTLESVQEVCRLDKEDESDIFLGVESLLNNSLIQPDYRGEIQPRFRMLETIREFAEDELANRSELVRIHCRHAQHFINLINQMNPLFSTREADRVLAWVDMEHDNLRSAMDYCLKETSLAELAPWLLITMAGPWYRRGFLKEGRDYANKILYGDLTKDNPLARSYALWASGAMAMWQGDLNDALLKLQEAATLSKTIEQPLAVAIAVLFLGTTQVNRGEDEFAVGNLKEALDLFSMLGLSWYQAVTLVHLANATLGMDDIDDARHYLDEAILISQQIEEKWLVSFIDNNYGEIARVQGDYRAAREYYSESEKLLRSMGDKGDLARLIHNQGSVELHLGDPQGAEKHYCESLAMFIKLGNQRGMAECIASIAGLWLERGQALGAARMLGAAQALLDETGATWWPADRGEVDRNLEKIKSTLDADEFEGAWKTGRAMNLEAAIDFASGRKGQ